MESMDICDACERHVYVDEPSCPFCGSAEPRRPIPRAPVRGPLSRAAAHAVRAAVLAGAVGGTAVATTGCHDTHGRDGERDAATTAERDAGSVDEVDAAVAVDAGRPTDAGEPGVDASTPSTPDAGDFDAGGGIPIYGGVFPDPRKRAVV